MVVQNADRLRIVEDAIAQLRGQLREAGVVLPSLGLDPVTAAADNPALPLVDLGRCNLDTVLRLAAALGGGRGV